jgi:hypothetical protein
MSMATKIAQLAAEGNDSSFGRLANRVEEFMTAAFGPGMELDFRYFVTPEGNQRAFACGDRFRLVEDQPGTEYAWDLEKLVDPYRWITLRRYPKEHLADAVLELMNAGVRQWASQLWRGALDR